MAIDLTIHGTGTGQCSLTAREGEGLTVSFKDGTLTETFLSWKGFQQLLGMKTGKNGRKTAAPPTPPLPPGATPPGPAAAPK